MNPCHSGLPNHVVADSFSVRSDSLRPSGSSKSNSILSRIRRLRDIDVGHLHPSVSTGRQVGSPNISNLRWPRSVELHDHHRLTLRFEGRPS